ncbi:hypothetical protein [Cellulomonas wangsupingiae]|uniref:Uncharacterized protein n=1 Tax=Cellulomonas wangsupingiae TaxID=2968085 RepID=A0ABY5K8U8_9CELL|nr:hypothetical protein [Cellulomonas wangsupingiae]UUI64838.1 hypothetical protein NP075_17260 [Cellulomonas wangsupingiae]
MSARLRHVGSVAGAVVLGAGLALAAQPALLTGLTGRLLGAAG